MQILVAHANMARFNAQARADAIRAGFGGNIFRQFFAHRKRIGFAIAAFQIRHDPFEHFFAQDRPTAFARIFEGDFFLAGAMQNQLLHVGRQLIERPFNVELKVLRKPQQHLKIELVASIPTFDRAAREREPRIGGDALRIEKRNLPQAIARWARTHRVVERKQARLHFGERVVARRAREF